jgi:NADPH-dependent 2,4-dienoyl-CoA reductase/sulfur reductase-like enzyme
LNSSATEPDVDVLIVGAGPAGLAAGIETARHGLRTMLLDENPAPGGRIWQALESRGAADADEASGIELIREFRASGVAAYYEASVWGIEPGGLVFWSRNGAARSSRARRIVLATGTTERPMPIAGWTLPGVMTVGAAQVALKTGRLVPDGGTWIAGQGPLTVLYAAQAIRAGGKLAGILDLSARSARWRALRHLPGALADLCKGFGWLREIRRADVPILRATDVRAMGDGALTGISFLDSNRWREQSADLLLLHDGVIPSIQLTRALGCAHVWDERQRCWRPRVNEWGETDVDGIVVAGDGAGVAGAAAAMFSGHIAGLGCAFTLGRIDDAARDREAVPLRRRYGLAVASRPFIDALFTPRAVNPDDDVLVCRCEEVTAGEVRAAVKLGCQGLNQLKAFTRCGMGPCQGRMCGTSVAEVFAAARGLHPREVEPYRTRFPARPLTVGELAGLER